MALGALSDSGLGKRGLVFLYIGVEAKLRMLTQPVGVIIVASLFLCVLLVRVDGNAAGYRLSALWWLSTVTMVLSSHRSLRIWCGLLLHLPEVVIRN